MKRSLIVCLIFCLFVPITLEAKKKPFGNGLFWELSADGTLTISGNGNMPELVGDSKKMFKCKYPWSNKLKKVRHIVIDQGVKSIARFAFASNHLYNKDLKNINSVTIARSVKQIDCAAFSGLGEVSVIYLSGISDWCSIDFCNEYANPLHGGSSLYLNGNRKYKIQSLTIPKEVGTIKQYAFSGCKSLREVKISDYVSIGEYAFSDCHNLDLVILPKSMKSISPGTFWKCTKLWQISLPESLEKIEDYAFYGCYTLEHCKLVNGLKCIGKYAFYECKSLRNISIPQSVTSVGDNAFTMGSVWNSTLQKHIDVVFSGTITQMPDFMLKDNPTKWGLSMQSVETYKSGIRDSEGKLVLAANKNLKTQKLSDANNREFYIVEEGNLKGAISSSGKWIIPMDEGITELEYIGDNFVRIKDKNYHYGIVTTDGKIVIPVSRNYYRINYNNNKKVFTTTKGKFSIVLDKQGQEVSSTRLPPDKYDIMSIGGYSNAEETFFGNVKYFYVTKNSRKGLTDAEGKVIVPAEMETLEPAGNGYLRYKLNGFWGLMNYAGKIIIDTNRGYTSIGNFVTFTKRFPYTMNGYKGECDINGRPVSKIKVETPKQQAVVKKEETPKKQEGSKTQTIIVEHHRDPIPVQQWQDCWACCGSGKMGCDFCGGSGTKYIGDRLQRCPRCNMSGEIPCNICYGRKGQYITVYQ